MGLWYKINYCSQDVQMCRYADVQVKGLCGGVQNTIYWSLVSALFICTSAYLHIPTSTKIPYLCADEQNTL